MNIHIEKTDGTNLPYRMLEFAGGERHVQLQDVSSLQETLILRACLTSSNDLVDLLLIENALRHAFGPETTINLELPYLPYARQDRVCTTGQAFSLEVMTGLLQLMQIQQLVTWDCHSDVGVTMTQAYNVNPATIIQSDAALSALLKQDDSVLICPDKGAVKRCAVIQQSFCLSEMVRCEKQRDPATGKIIRTDVFGGDLSGRCAVITDDICDGGYTFIKIAEQLRTKQVERIALFVTHGIFSKGLEVFDGLIDEIITTNSLPQQPHPALRVISYKHNFGAQS